MTSHSRVGAYHPSSLNPKPRGKVLFLLPPPPPSTQVLVQNGGGDEKLTSDPRTSVSSCLDKGQLPVTTNWSLALGSHLEGKTNTIPKNEKA